MLNREERTCLLSNPDLLLSGSAAEELSESCEMYPLHRQRYKSAVVSVLWLCMAGMGDATRSDPQLLISTADPQLQIVRLALIEKVAYS